MGIGIAIHLYRLLLQIGSSVRDQLPRLSVQLRLLIRRPLPEKWLLMLPGTIFLPKFAQNLVVTVIHLVDAKDVCGMKRVGVLARAAVELAVVQLLDILESHFLIFKDFVIGNTIIAS